MATNFPTSLDSYSAHTNGQVIATADVNNLQDAVAALETKVGVNGSAVTTSLDYQISHLAAGVSVPLHRRGPSQISTFDPSLLVSSTSIGLGSNTYFAFFSAPMSYTTAGFRLIVGATASGTATIGLYSIDASDNGTLLTTGTFTGATTGLKTGSWAASQALTAGSRYAIGVAAGSAAGISVVGLNQPANANLEANVVPHLWAAVTTGTQANFLVGALVSTAGQFYVALT